MSPRALAVALLVLVCALGLGWRLLGRGATSNGVAGPGATNPAAAVDARATLESLAVDRDGGPQRVALGSAELSEVGPPEDSAAPASIQISGRVRDTHGEPKDQHLVGLYPAASPPPASPAEWLALPHARTDARGAFLAELPSAGDWRLFVGFGGKVLIEDHAAHHVTHAAPGIASVVVPAAARLEVRVEDALTVGGARPAARRTVSVYRSPSTAEAERRATFTAPTGPRDFGPHFDNQGFDESAPEPNAPPRPALSPLVQRLHELRPTAAPSDSLVVFSALVGRDGRVVFENAPVGQALRFAASQDDEAFHVEGAVQLAEGAHAIVRLALPAPLPEDGPLPTALRSVPLQHEPSAAGAAGPPLVPGVTWR